MYKYYYENLSNLEKTETRKTTDYQVQYVVQCMLVIDSLYNIYNFISDLFLLAHFDPSVFFISLLNYQKCVFILNVSFTSSKKKILHISKCINFESYLLAYLYIRGRQGGKIFGRGGGGPGFRGVTPFPPRHMYGSNH